MAEQILELYSQNHWLSNGTDTLWNFTFQGGYISKSHVKAYMKSPAGDITTIPIVDADFVGPYQLNVIPAIPNGYVFVIYRDTPKTGPLVDFQDGANVSEASLDLIARQAILCCAEVLDGSGQTLVLDELGFRSLKQNVYTGASVVLHIDNGKSHFKTDASAVTVPNTLNTGHLTTLINYSEDAMPVTFTSAVARQQGVDDDAPYTTWLVSPWNTLTIMKVANGAWLISGKAAPA